MLYYLTVTLISAGAAFFSGLLGIGGGIILIPSYLYLFPIFGFDTFTVNTITGISAIQTASGGLFAYINHRQTGLIEKKAAGSIILAALLGVIFGVFFSKFLSGKQLLAIYLVILSFAAFSFIIPKPEECFENCEYKSPNPLLTNSIIFISTGVSAAMGFGGAVYFIYVLNQFYKMPIKKTISTVTYLVLITTTATLLGKIMLGMVPFKLILFIIIGSAIGAKIGTIVNTKLSPERLKIIFLAVVLIIWTRVFVTVFWG